MHRARALSRLLGVLFALLVASKSMALANRVFLSARSGSDANSCDNVATPCQTLAGAIVQLNAGGEAIVLDSGGYGPVTITKALTIEAPPGVVAFIHPPSGDAITISAGASARVVLRGLVLNDGSNVGIRVNTVGTLQIESCVIGGFASQGVNSSSAGVLEMRDTIVRSSGDAAVLVQPTGSASLVLDRCRFSGNNLGVSIHDGTKATASETVFTGQLGGAVGAALFGAGPVEFNLEDCVISNNGVGIVSNGALVRVSNSTLTNNGTALQTFNSGSIDSRSNNTLQGNTTTGAFTGFFTAD